MEKTGDLNHHLASANAELAKLRAEAATMVNTFKVVQSPDLIRQLEKDYEQLIARIKLLEAKRDEKEYSEADMNRAIAMAKYLVEHLDELIMEPQDDGHRSIFWSLIFERTPTLSELQNRTAPLSPLVRLKDDFGSGQTSLARQNELKRNRILEELIRWHDGLLPLLHVLSTRNTS